MVCVRLAHCPSRNSEHGAWVLTFRIDPYICMQRNMDTDVEKKGNSWLWWLLGIAGAIVLLSALLPMFNESNNVSQNSAVPGVPSAGTEEVTTIGDIIGNPTAFEGQSVTLSGDVEQILGMNAFVLDEAGLEDDAILIVVPEGHSFTTGGTVTVTGAVQSISMAELESGLEIQFPTDLEQELDQRPIIVTTQVSAQD